jgi:hypothetical protein
MNDFLCQSAGNAARREAVSSRGKGETNALELIKGARVASVAMALTECIAMSRFAAQKRASIPDAAYQRTSSIRMRVGSHSSIAASP